MAERELPYIPDRQYAEVSQTPEVFANHALFFGAFFMESADAKVIPVPVDDTAVPAFEAYSGPSPVGVDSPELIGLLDAEAEPGFDPGEVQSLGADEFDLVA